MSSHSIIQDLDAKLFSVRQERCELFNLGIVGSLSHDGPLAVQRRNRCRVLCAIEFRLLSQKLKLLESEDGYQE